MITQFTADQYCFKNFSQISFDSIQDQLHVEFDSQEQRDLFVSQFPKSMNVRTRQGGRWSCGTNNLPRVEGVYIVNVYSAFIFINRTKNNNGSINKVTGAANEQGMKRLTRFYKAIEAELSK